MANKNVKKVVVLSKNTKRPSTTNLPALEKFPLEKIGKYHSWSGFTYSPARDWVEEETLLLIDWYKQGYHVDDIASALHRSDASITNKVRRVKKWIIDEYNSPEARTAKYTCNKKFLGIIGNAKTCLDAYAGCGSYWTTNTKLKVVTNDDNEEFNTMYHMKADKLVAKMYSEGKKFDIVDIDPYGSPYLCINHAIAIAKKGLILTFGEKGHIQQNRTDYVEACYGIKTIKKLTVNSLISYVKKIGNSYNKELEAVVVFESNSIWRVYFTVKKRTTIRYNHKEHMTEERRIAAMKNLPEDALRIISKESLPYVA